MNNRDRNVGPVPRLDHVEYWIFDLDNTLYSARHNLFAQIDQRMGEFIADFLDLDPVAAKRVQKSFFHQHGTTLRGMMLEHAMAPEPFLDYVHEIDLSVIPPDSRLDAALESLPGRKFIFTNASSGHADRVTRRLGIRRHFEDLFDIVDCDYLPKPTRAPYEKLLSRHGMEARRAAMFEDIPRNLEPAAALGMTTVLVPNPSAWARDGSDGGHIHHVVEDLGEWLAAVARARAAG